MLRVATSEWLSAFSDGRQVFAKRDTVQPNMSTSRLLWERPAESTSRQRLCRPQVLSRVELLHNPEPANADRGWVSVEFEVIGIASVQGKYEELRGESTVAENGRDSTCLKLRKP